MAQVQDPASGINSWLEEELYHQYQFDRGSVDRGWVDLFNRVRNLSPVEWKYGDCGGRACPLRPETGAKRNGAAVLSEPDVPTGPPVSQQDPPVEVPPAKEPPAPVTPEREPSTGEPPRVEPPQPTPAPQESAARSVQTPGPAAAPGVAEITRTASPAPAKQDSKAVGASDQLIPLRGVAARIVENMTASLSIPDRHLPAPGSGSRLSKRIATRSTSSARCRARASSASLT